MKFSEQWVREWVNPAQVLNSYVNKLQCWA